MDAQRQKKSMSVSPLYHTTINKPLRKDRDVSVDLKASFPLHMQAILHFILLQQETVERHEKSISIQQKAMKKSKVRCLQLLTILVLVLVTITASLSGALVQKAVQITNIKEEQRLTNTRIADAFAKIDDLDEDFDGKIKNLENRTKNFEDSLKCVETLALVKAEIPDKTPEAEGPVFKGYQ